MIPIITVDKCFKLSDTVHITLCQTGAWFGIHGLVSSRHVTSLLVGGRARTDVEKARQNSLLGVARTSIETLPQPATNLPLVTKPNRDAKGYQ